MQNNYKKQKNVIILLTRHKKKFRIKTKKKGVKIMKKVNKAESVFKKDAVAALGDGWCCWCWCA